MRKNIFAFAVKACAAFSAVLTVLLWVLYAAYRWDWCLTAAISAGVTAYHFIMRLTIGYLIPAITGYQFDYRAPWFQLRSWEPGLYRSLRLQKLKKYLPTYAPSLYDLSKNSLCQIIRNTCGAEIVHEIIMVFSFLPMLLIPRFGEFGVFLITSSIAAFGDSFFVMAQRYNRPRLVRIYEKQEAKTL